MPRTAPRLYDLYPLLAGPIARWADHLPRVVAMGFDWVYVNAFWVPGASGSIYAVRDPFELHPVVRGDAREPADRLVAAFAETARAHGLALMVDLIVPHAARNSRLVEEHPSWFKRKDGELTAPVLANPTPTSSPLYDGFGGARPGRSTRPDQLAYFTRLASHFLGLGAAGFRCSAAYKVPPDFWRELIRRVRDGGHPDAIFLAAALGCPFDLVRGLAGCGFDLIFDSSRWWDFRGHWFLDQYEELRRIAPTVSFPEDHNTPRLAVAFDAHEPQDGPSVPRPLSVRRYCRERPLDADGLRIWLPEAA